MADLLPPNATAAERALAEATGRLGTVPVPVGDLWSPDRCPAPLLTWLAWALSVDVWSTDWPEATQRATIRAAMDRHRKKGSIGSIRAALAELGFEAITITEGTAPPSYDGSIVYDGSATYGANGSWAEYTVETAAGMTPEDFDLIRRSLATVQPVRCRLVSLRRGVAPGTPVYDGTHAYDGLIDYS